MTRPCKEMYLFLLQPLCAQDPVVQEQVRKSILTLGNQQPDKVLSMCQDYLLKHPKLVVGHRVVILQTIELVVKSRIDDISYPKIKSVIQLASDEMTKSKEVVPEWQQAASNILVAVGNKYINDIMEEILGKFQPGVLPHFFVVQTLANLSDSNVYGMVPFLNAIMGTMLPMLGMTKQDNMKWVFSSALCRFSESILEYLANLDKAPDPTVRKDTFSSEIYSAYDILFNSWIQSRESKLRLTVAEALGSMSHLMAHDKLEEQLPKLLPTILGLYKKNSEHYIITKSLCQVLEASVNMGSRVLETQIDGLLLALHQQICSPVDFSNPPTVKNHNEVLRCFTILANTFPDRLMVFVLQRLENSNERNRMGSLAVLRHLINSSTSIMETKKLLILASIRQPLADHSNKVKKRVVQVISAMAHHGYLELEGGDLLVRFIIQHCALPDTYHRPPDPEEVTNEALRSMCDNTLHLFTTTVGRLTDVLWPMLLCYLTPNQYASATTPLCKSLILLANKKRAAQEASFIINFNAQGVDTHTYGHDVTDEPSPRLRAFPLSDLKTPWNHTFCLLGSVSFLYRCIGVILQQCYNKELVRKQLQEILISTRHNDAIERTGVAMGIGLCASSHLNGTLEKLEEFGKSDAFRKASGIFGLLKDKNDVDVEKMKSTLILCYGYVALHAPEDQLLTRIDSDILQNISKNFNTKVKHIVTPLYILWFKSIIVVQKYSSYWLSSGQDHERERAVKTTAELLQFYLDNLSVKNLVTFHNLGALVGRLSPRCTDPNPEVRRAAIDCIYRLMYIQLRYEGTDCFFIAQLGLTVFLKLTLFLPLHSLCLQQLSTLLFMLFDGLVDSQSNCSRASSVILNTLLKNRGAGLQDLVPEMLEVLHNRLQVIGEEQVKVAIGQSILILATQHLQTVVNTLVAYPLPYDSWSCEMWMALGADSTLALQIMEMIIEKLNVMVPYVDKKESMLRPGLTKVATSQPLAMTCALREMMLNGQSADAVAYVFPKLFSSLLVRLGSSVGVQLPKDLNSNSIISDCKTTNKMNVINFDVCGVAVEALRILLGRAQLDAVMKPLDQEGAWDKMKDPQQHTTGVTLAMAKHAGPRLPAIVEGLCPSLCNIYECQRITVTAFFSELLNHHVVTELMILDMLMNNMMERITDTCGTVRMLAVRGLGNIAVGSPEKVNKYAKELLAAMSSGMEEKDDPGKLITLEAMSGMSKILLLENSVLASMGFLLLYGFTQRSIVMFCQENDEIRCASIMLLGNLSKFGSGEPVFKDQIHNVLVSLLLHLSDPNPQVVKACKYSMRICAPIVGSEQISAMFQNHLLEEKGLHYGEFINDLTKYLIQDFPGMLNFYHITVIQFFKSNWAEIRASAAMFIGKNNNNIYFF
uniref:Maestro heat-like repeat-containing protein family member 1 n=1 Tax=Sinocyclocheilus anshuiensis TaxID=1608454 RepID=A0A671LQI6_9TELE